MSLTICNLLCCYVFYLAHQRRIVPFGECCCCVFGDPNSTTNQHSLRLGSYSVGPKCISSGSGGGGNEEYEGTFPEFITAVGAHVWNIVYRHLFLSFLDNGYHQRATL